jgi:glycosyltransferase involved in cell wall biosynthesis
MNNSPYILVTAARNEASHILPTLRSVTAQTLPPRRWIIVSDGSTDQTDEIVRSFSRDYPYVELLRVDADAERNFGSKALAVAAGYKKICEMEHDYVGILDADVSFGTDYYAQIVERFSDNERLGIAGGVLTDLIDGQPVPQLTAPAWSVSGPVQMFRKECWRDIGGYLPIRGGIDAAAEVMARMKGWTVCAFPELQVLHHRQTGTENHTVCGIYFHQGLEDHRLGYHPLFFLAKSVRNFRMHPFVLGGLLMLCGYSWAVVSRKKRAVPEDFIRYLRQEQLRRLRDELTFRKDKSG